VADADGSAREVPRDAGGGRPVRPVCPQCGSVHTQPFTHGGPAARYNMKCNDCGHLFKHKTPRPLD